MLAFLATILFERELLPILAVAHILILTFLNRYIRIRVHNYLCAFFLLAFFVIQLPQWLALANFIPHSLFDTAWGMLPVIALVEWPIFQLGLPAAILLSCSLIRTGQSIQLSKLYQLIGVILIAFMSTFLYHHYSHPITPALITGANLFEISAITNMLLLLGIISLLLSRLLNQLGFLWAGLTLCAVGFFRVVWFSLLLDNPWDTMFTLGTWPVFNNVQFVYGLPIVLGFFARQIFKGLNSKTAFNATNSALLGFSFVWITMLIRHAFVVSDLGGSDAELYTYSATWLIYGLALIAYGAWKNLAPLRYVALALIVLCLFKIVFVDTAELEGLYRVLSFLGLGVVLLLTSYLYNRFVHVAKT